MAHITIIHPETMTEFDSVDFEFDGKFVVERDTAHRKIALHNAETAYLVEVEWSEEEWTLMQQRDEALRQAQEKAMTAQRLHDSHLIVPA